jgi:hypothetical protein
VQALPLNQVTITRSPLNQVPLNQVPLNQVGAFVDCSKVDCATATFGIAAHAGAIKPGKTYGELLEALPLNQVPLLQVPLNQVPLNQVPLNQVNILRSPLNQVPLNQSPLNQVPLNQVDIANSPLNQVPLNQVPLNQVDLFVDCSKVDCATATFGDAALAGAIKPGPTYSDVIKALPLNQVPLNQIGNLVDCSKVDCTTETLGDAVLAHAITDGATLAGLIPYLPNDFTFGQMMLALINPDTFPWEQLPYASMNAQSIASGGTLPFSLTFTLTGPAATAPAEIQVTMPPEALYRGGSATLGPAGSPSQALDDPSVNGSELSWSLPSVSTGVRYVLRFTLLPGVTVGRTQATATVNSAVAAPAGVAITPTNAGHATARAALTVQPGRVYFGYVSQPGDVHYYRVPAQPEGSRVLVRLANLTSDSALSGDDDLVVYAEAGSYGGDESKLKAAGTISDQALPAADDPSAVTQQAVSNEQLRGGVVLGESANGGGVPESVSLVAPRTGISYLIQVSGYNRQTSNLPFALRVEVDPPPTGGPTPVPRTFPFAGEGTAGTLPESYDDYLNTLFLVDAKRIGDTYGAADESKVMSALNALAGRTDLGVNGAVVPVEGDPAVADAYQAWDADPYSPELANAVVRAIGALVDQIHATHPYLKYLVVVGSDDIVPMARVPDLTQTTNEEGYAAHFSSSPNEYYGAFASRDLLSDQPYATTHPVSLGGPGGRVLYVPDLAVGRLVETPDDIVGALTQFQDFTGTLDPTTALTTGYDFLGNGSRQIADTLSKRYGTSHTSTLLTETWTHTDLVRQLFPPDGVVKERITPGIVSLNAHADQSGFLPAEGNATNVETGLFSVSDLSTLPPGGLAGTAGAIWFSMGCHAGLSVSDAVAGTTLGADWPQTIAGRQRAVYLANTGFGLGDSTGAVAYSVRLMALFARHLDGTESVGRAWTAAVRDYYAGLGRVSVADEKAIEEATLYRVALLRDRPRAGGRAARGGGGRRPGGGAAGRRVAAGRPARRARLAAVQLQPDTDAGDDAERRLLRRRRRHTRRPL